jgi:hypothetical protein
MAEFKLGRIRFVWKGNWTTGESYLVDDVVSAGGKSYICVVNHTASALFGTDLGFVPTKWNIVSDGSSWLGDWQGNSDYNPGAIVKYGALIYICKTAHQSAPSTATLTSTGITLNGTSATITFSAQVVQPYLVGSTITLAGFSPSSTSGSVNTVNTTFTVTACTLSSVTFALTGTYTAATLGTVSGTSQLGLEKNLSSWDLFAESFNWEGAWTVSTRYRKNDFVSYGGQTYVCNAGHVSDSSVVAGLEIDASKWDYFNKGIIYLGDWNPSTVRYKENDVVKFGANLYICTTYHTSSSLFDETKWSIFVNGFQFESSWSSATVYQPGDTVTYGGYSYIAKTNHTNKQPTDNASDWDVFTTGFKFEGEWNTGINYRIGSVIRYGALTYVAKLDNIGQIPTNATYWSLLNTGFRWTNTPQTYLAVTSTAITGTGTNARFDVVRSGTVYSVSVASGFAGAGYVTGNKIKVLGSAVGGLSPVNDITITVVLATAGVINNISWTGGSVTWTTSTGYLFGDVVSFGANSYVCINAHTSGGGSRPDADLTGLYWNLLTAGAESSILTTPGDTLYYGENGPTRLPVGINGQVLRSQDGYPIWANYGLINNLVYVGPLGSDIAYPEAGATIDQPWKTINFAAKQIEDGYLNPQAKYLLAMNKQYIIKEITQWIIFTYTVSISQSTAAGAFFTCTSTANLIANMPIKFSSTLGGVTAGTTYYVNTIVNSTTFTISNTSGGTVRALTDGSTPMTGTLSYDSALCERDVGLIVEAVKYDISHGGNAKTTAAAKSYYTSAGNAYINSNFGAQLTQTISAYGYLGTLINLVITNTVGTSYQTTNGVVGGITQSIDNTLNAEANVTTQVTGLLSIITSGLTVGSASSIPAAINSNTTLSVKTGTYNEILPIVIPENTALTGDELRSTVIQPKLAHALLANDIPKQTATLTRISSLVSDMIQNIAVTPTAGNTQPQVNGQVGSVGSALAVSRVENSANIIYDIASSGVGTVPTFALPDPTGYGTSLTDVAYAVSGNATGATSTYNNARLQLASNYAFIRAEITAYFVTFQGSAWSDLGATGQAAILNDVTYIVDAIRYDITYGGNTQSQVMGRSYYSNFNITLSATARPAVVAAYGRLLTIVGQIAQRVSVTPTSGNATSQSLPAGAGNSFAGLFAQNRVQTVLDWINNGAGPAVVNPATTWATSVLQSSFAALQLKKTEIQSDVVQWVYKNYQDLNFNAELCSRDTGYMVDALSYDLLTGSNFAAISAGRRLQASTPSAQLVVTSQLNAELGSINFLKFKAKHIAANGAVANTQTIIADIIGSINSGAVPRVQWRNPSTIISGYAAATVLLTDNKEFIKSEIIAFIANQIATSQSGFVGLEYDPAVYRTDVDYVIDALRYDLTYGYGMGGTTNYATRQVALAYYSGFANTLQITSANRAAVISAYTRLKTVVQAIVQDNAVTPTVGNTATQVRIVTGQTAGSGASATSIGTLVDVLTTTINSQASVPAQVVPVTAWVSAALTAQNAALQANKSAITAIITAYIAEFFPTLVYNVSNFESEVSSVIDVVGYDMMFESNYLSIYDARNYFRTLLTLKTQRKAAIAAFRELKTRMLAVVVDNPTVVRRVKTLMDISINILVEGIGAISEVTGTIHYKNDVTVFKGAETLRLNKEFLAEEARAFTTISYGGTVTVTTASSNQFTTSSTHKLTVGDPVVFSGSVITNSGVSAGTTYYVLTTPTSTTFTITTTATGTAAVDITVNGTGSMTVRYSFDTVTFKQDIRNYIDAIVYDLSYTGNYKSLRVAELYNNSVNGSQLSNMFYVSNATGLRNCTLNGLNGTMSEVNDFGTKRPTAGAYVALNPGFGPNDSNVWVNTRSHYSQNVSLFGTGCTGAKIDGAVHAGGNRSMVKNDFTTIISDGFGVWCTGANSLTELVSVFAYYSYSGYMAELGGRIRATNGNSSYGTYGVIAEGTDTYEQPIFAVIDNHAQQAFANKLVTDGVDQVLQFEFNNAGTNYTNATVSIGGSGVNATAVADEFRDSGVFETRLLDLNDGNGFGGTNYQTSINAAQSGDAVSITIANSDVALSTAYPSMRVQLTAGSGVGQYANILTYNNGTKVAQVYKDRFETLTVTATAVTGNLLTVASTATLFAGMPIYLTGTMSGTGGATGLSANTLYYVRTTGLTATQFSVSTTGAGGTAVTISNNVSALTIGLLAAGWDHVIPGRAISAGIDLTTSYIIEPRINYSHPGYTATARTLIGTTTWGEATYGNNKYIAIANTGTTTNFSLNGKTWAAGGALSASASWIDVVYGGGEGATATAVVGGLGGAGAVLTAVRGVTNSVGAPGADQIVSVTIVNAGFNYTTAPTIVFTPVSGGLGATATCTVLNGKIDSVTVTVNGSGYNANPTVTAATDRVSSIVVNTWGKNYGIGTTTVTVSGGGSGNQATATPVFDNAGVKSITIGNAGGSGYTSTPTVTITDTNAKFIAIASGTIDTSYLPASSANNAAWTAGGQLPVGFTAAASIAYGNGIWVTVGGTSSAASSTNGTAWIGRTIPTTTGTWSSAGYGAGRFVAVSTGAQATAYSTNGSTWVAGGNLPSSTTWTSVAYGNGRWVAIASGGRTTAYSLNDGVTWIAATPGLPSTQTWNVIRYAQGIFVAIASASAVCAVSSDGINWYSRTMPGASTNWSGLAFGDVANNPLWIAISATSGTTAASFVTGARTLGRMETLSGNLLEVRITEPGSAYPKGIVSATTATTNLITVDNTENLVNLQPVSFVGLDSYGLISEKVYYVIGATITSTQFKVSLVSGSGTPVVLTTATGLSSMYRAGPIITQFDPNKVVTAAIVPRTGDSVLGNPSFTNRGTGFVSATGSFVGDGFADLYQPSKFVAVRNLYKVPQAGSNVVFGSIPGIWYKLVAVTNVLGNPGSYSGNFQISPALSVLNAPRDADSITTTLKYSQVRLTGHDFLYIGTGNQADTNYPFVDPTAASIDAQTKASGGGRVFFTSTDQDGNFNVGGLFGVQQSTGTATLNADAFNLSGLQSLQLSGLTVGTGSAVINQFSTDPFFTADSDEVVPTQRAIKAYITAQIGGGQSSLNVNTLTSGVIYVANDSISTTSGGQINIKSKMNFTGGIDGAPVALGFFLSR